MNNWIWCHRVTKHTRQILYLSYFEQTSEICGTKQMCHHMDPSTRAREWSGCLDVSAVNIIAC